MIISSSATTTNNHTTTNNDNNDSHWGEPRQEPSSWPPPRRSVRERTPRFPAFRSKQSNKPTQNALFVSCLYCLLSFSILLICYVLCVSRHSEASKGTLTFLYVLCFRCFMCLLLFNRDAWCFPAFRSKHRTIINI